LLRDRHRAASGSLSVFLKAVLLVSTIVGP
jgi:hypothetical protein